MTIPRPGRLLTFAASYAFTGGKGGGALIEPGEIRLSPAERTAKRINQDTKARLPKLTTGLTKRQYPLHPTIAFHTRRPIGAFAPQHAKTSCPLGAIIRRFHPVLRQKHPQRCHLAL